MTRFVIAIVAASVWILPTPGVAAIDLSSGVTTDAASGMASRMLLAAAQIPAEPAVIPQPVFSPPPQALPLVDAFALHDEEPLAESQAIVAIEPLVSVVVPEPHSLVLWVLTMIAALCGSRAWMLLHRAR